MTEYDLPEDDVSTYGRASILFAAVVSLVVTAVLAWAAAGFDVFYEELFRVAPTVEGGGVGANWVTGNTMPVLDFLIALIHAADVILGVFILLLVFIHWSAFRRLAAQMRPPGRTRSGTSPDAGSERPDGGETE